MSRQKLVGWILIVVGGAYLIYFLRVRLLAPGPVLEKKEWINFFGSLLAIFLGTITVRMALMRERLREG